jgi:tetratricopeptide (TPR) repeat protein
MDLSALSKMSDKRTKSLNDDRQKRSDKLYRLGTEYLNRSKANDFRDREQVKKAAICFGHAIESNRRDPRPHLKLGYISMVFREYKMATRHLNEVLRLEPDHKQAKKLLAHLEQKSTQAIRAARKKDNGLTLKDVKRLTPPIEATGKTLYNQTQELIQTQIRESFERMKGIQPTLVPVNLSKFEEIHQQLECNYDWINQQLDQLEQEGFDIEALERELQKFEVNLNLMEDTCKLSREMITLKKAMQEETSKIQDWNVDAERGLSAEQQAQMENNFDQMVDRCDELADHLDTLEGSGFDIQPLMKYYNQLNASFDRFGKLLGIE